MSIRRSLYIHVYMYHPINYCDNHDSQIHTCMENFFVFTRMKAVCCPVCGTVVKPDHFVTMNQRNFLCDKNSFKSSC